MPGDDGLRLDDHQRGCPSLPQDAEPGPENAVVSAHGWGRDLAVQHQQWVSQS